MAAHGTVLIVDDEALVRWSLRERFLQQGYSVLESGTAIDAVREFSRGGVDVVLLDCRLPDSDGIAVLRVMKTLSPQAKVILMTAFPTIENASEAAQYGARDYLVKPFDLDDVVERVEKLGYPGRP
jgi:two-component system, NtrC family, response regulator AtoC